MRFTHDGHIIEVFSENIDDLANDRNFELVDVVGVSPHFIKFVFEAQLDEEDVEIQVTYGHDNYLDAVTVTDSSQENLFYKYLSNKDFEKGACK